MTTGSKVLAYYLLMTYGAQTVLSLLLPDYYDQDYKGYTDGLYWKTILMIAIGAAIYYGQAFLNNRPVRGRVNVSSAGRLLAIIFYGLRLPSASVFVALSIPFGLEYGFSFFHSGLYISDLPFWVVLLQAMKSIARLDLAYCAVKMLRGERLSNFDIAVTALYTAGGIVSLAGAIDIVFLALGVVLIYRRGELAMRAFAVVETQSRKTVRWIVYGLLIASLPAAAIIGFANKIGFDRTFALVSDRNQFVEAFAVPLALRVSSSHGSFVANAELPLSISEQFESISYPINNLTWRGCILFVQVGCPYRNDITHIARLNYVRTFWEQSPLKAGATPGLLASALYIPFLPLSIAFLIFYCSIFTGAINQATNHRKLPLPGNILLVLFTYPAFENPVDLLVVLDPSFFYTVGLYFVFRSFRMRLAPSMAPRPVDLTPRALSIS